MMTETLYSDNDLENILLVEMSKLPTHPMTTELSELFLRICMIQKQSDIDNMFDEFKSKSWQLNALSIRVNKCLDVKIDKRTLLFILILTESNIGECIMYVYLIQYWAKRNSLHEITFDTFSMNIFPNGFYSSLDLRKMWDLQKTFDNKNLIDNPEAAKSIMLFASNDT